MWIERSGSLTVVPLEKRIWLPSSGLMSAGGRVVLILEVWNLVNIHEYEIGAGDKA
jgi:predicted acyltransferase